NASISAWAVGSLSRSVRLPARATIPPSHTITQPIGTSPAACAARASSIARSMNDGFCTRLLRTTLSLIREPIMARKSENPAAPEGERIARVIAGAGLASRREAEAWIAAGRVAVNGEVISSPALNVAARDRIVVDGEPLPARERTRLFLYNK